MFNSMCVRGHACVGVCMNVHMQVCIRVCMMKSEVDPGVFLYHSLPDFFETGSLAEPGHRAPESLPSLPQY